MAPLRFHLSPFGSRVGPFCLHFWCILGPFLVFFSARRGYPFYCPFISISGAVFGSILGPFWRPNSWFFQWKIVSFFQSIFNAFLLSFWELFCTQIASKIASETKKSILWKWASRAGESSIFKSGGPKILAKDLPKSIKKTMHFWSEKCIENWSQNEAPRHYKLGKKTFKKQH